MATLHQWAGRGITCGHRPTRKVSTLTQPSLARRRPILRTIVSPTVEPVIASRATDASREDTVPVSIAPSSQQGPASPPYAWARNWVPVAPVSFLDPSRPTPVTLLGEPLVVWQAAGSREWVVMRDACPHRLAPLSEGRLEAGGTRLACAYHGWEFGESGECVRVPQLSADPRAAATACASPRACVPSYPTLLHEGILFAWLDASGEGRAAAAATPPPRLFAEEATPTLGWVMNELPNDYKFWVEQGMDPAHAPFLHHGTFNQYDAVPMEGGRVREVDLVKGWRWEHRGYEKRNKEMHALREFVPPFVIRCAYEQPNGSVLHICTMQVPVRPGVSRVYFRTGASKRAPRQKAVSGDAAAPAGAAGAEPAGAAVAANGAAAGSASGAAAPAAADAGAGAGPANAEAPAAKAQAKAKAGGGGGGGGLFALLGKLPHWVFTSQLIADQDVIMMCRQELLMRRQGLGARAYNLNSRSDEGVSAINRWLELAGYPHSLWGARPAARAPGATYPGWPEQELPLEAILSRRERHVRHCAVCQRGIELVTRLCVAATAAAALAACGAAGLAVVAAVHPQGLAAVGGWGALAGAAGAAAALVWAAVRAWGFREERFVSGAAQWRRMGGFAVLNSKFKK